MSRNFNTRYAYIPRIQLKLKAILIYSYSNIIHINQYIKLKKRKDLIYIVEQ